MTRQERFKKLVRDYFKANNAGDVEAWEQAAITLRTCWASQGYDYFKDEFDVTDEFWPSRRVLG